MLDKLIKKAQKEKWAIGQFNISNLETLRAILSAGEKQKSPVIIGTSEGESQFIGGLKESADLIKIFKKIVTIPVFLNLDHGRNLEYIKRAIEVGYDLVHFDGSRLTLKENILITKEVIKFARKKGVLVEGEVGTIGEKLTEPEEVEKFVKETEVDILAINIGTWHGQGEKIGIDFKRLEEIKEAVKNVPLVLHGGSGVPFDHIKKAINLGISKININTELRMAFTNTLKTFFEENQEEITPYKYMPRVMMEVQKVVEEKIKLFGSENKII